MHTLLWPVAVLTLSIACSSSGQSKNNRANTVEVLHWWTSGAEAAALQVLRRALTDQAIGWVDMPVAGGGGSNAMTVLRARVASGNPPTAVQMLGFDILDWGAEKITTDLNDVAKAEGWNEVVPKALQAFSVYDGAWIAAPVNVHSTNWIWANRKILDEVGIKPPQTWQELVGALDAIQRAGYIALAHGGQAWQEATIFDSVVLATGGPEFYRKAMIARDDGALRSATMREVFARMRTLRTYVDPNFPGRDWNLASAMVIKGRAAMQIMGDWAKGEFSSANQKSGEDFLCFRFPGTQGSVLFNSDQFVMFDVGDKRRPAQVALARSILSPEFQIAFNRIKGSVPARIDVSDHAFDDCGKKAMAELKQAADSGTLLGSFAHGHTGPAAVKNAIYDVVTEHFNGNATPEQATAQLVDAVRTASQ
ncbi:MAG: ABC transporter substrate-binding protein [Proteobacteria bacterium]|nr:ABC transporter substrate-binding protein [Pseudomonadota bacterium]